MNDADFRAWEDELLVEDEDPLSPARGVVYGLIGGLALWALAGALSKIVVRVWF